ncbi:hypothetical protein CPB83DRAFT_854214 [Crepidotus variabilis]|uniref:F-box domain-containing protein n=1 Tax=Crepidotus variabilis TaxID=179855 RepID=A0A9P6EGI9_9AGAR|nr:hypothetical protein CPB83DRAFT_854214 [Crepidotus variabilis]
MRLSGRFWMKPAEPIDLPGPFSLEPLLALPLELQLGVIQYLEDDDLYTLGATCKSLHYLCFSTFLQNNNIPELAHYERLTIPEVHPLTPHFVQAARSIKKLRYIDMHMSKGCQRLLDDVEYLNQIVRNVESIEGTKIDFNLMDSWAWKTSQKALDKYMWVKGFTDLLDIMIDKGCQEMDILGSDAVKRLYTELERDGIPSETLPGSSSKDFVANAPRPLLNPKKSGKDRRHWPGRESISRIFGKSEATPPPGLPITNNMYTSRRSGSYSMPQLQRLRIESSMLLQYSFYPWTIEMLSQTSSTLTRLSLQCSALPISTWTRLLSSITLPSLTILALGIEPYKNGDTQCPNFVDLVAFFKRHPTIEELSLQGVERPEVCPILKKPILPALKKMMANPVWISCLVGVLDQYPDALPDLNTVGITTEYCSFEDENEDDYVYRLLDDALQKLSNFPRNITLALCLPSKKGMCDWFDKHISRGKRNSVIVHLTCVTALDISTLYFVDFGREEAQGFPGLVGLFPSLERIAFKEVRVGDNDGYELLKDDEFLTQLACASPTLSRVEAMHDSKVVNSIQLRPIREQGLAWIDSGFGL